MYAVEFEASISDGVVRIPTTFRKLYSSTKVRIIIMVDDEENVAMEETPSFIEMLANNPRPIDSSTLFLSREQANER